LGTGFLYVAPQHHDKVVEPVLGWGRLQPKLPASWDQEQFWLGTRNVAGALAIPAAIEYFQKLGLDQVRSRLRYLAATAEHMLLEALGTNTIASRSDGWYGLMAHVALPVGDWSNLQNDLWEKSKIEIPVWELNDRWWIRVSCHLYNSTDQLEFLLAELTKHLP
jgi:isopenicillin-N epimerase